MQTDSLMLSNRDKILLRELSTNSRASATYLAKTIGCSIATVTKLMERLTRLLDIRFTLEIDMDKLGLSERHILAVKFKKIPSMDFLEGVFNKDVHSQDVYLTKGDFDVLMFVVADTPINYIAWETNMAANISEYSPSVRPSEFVFPQLGFIPLSETFTGFIREEFRLDTKDKLILKILNSNSRVGYRELSRASGINEDTVRYRVFKLVHRGIIRRFTIAVQQPSSGTLIAYFMRYSFNKTTTTRAFPMMRKHYMREDEGVPLINRFPIIAPISGSYRSFGMVFGRDKKDAFYNGITWHKNVLKNEDVVESHATVIKPIKGILPLRNLDATSNYRYIWR